MHLGNYGYRKISRGRKFKVAMTDRQFWSGSLSLDLALNRELAASKYSGGQTAGKVLRVHLYLFAAQMGQQGCRKGLEKC